MSDASATPAGEAPDAFEAYAAAVLEAAGGRATRVPSLPHELHIDVPAEAIVAVMTALRDDPRVRCEVLVDLSGIDYLTFGRDEWSTHAATGSGFSRGVTGRYRAEPQAAPLPAAPVAERRFAVVYQLLSIAHNRRVRVRAYCAAGEPPVIDTVTDVWSGANWFEREAFDLYGILFRGHPDLRRILTDYGFIGHPFRKDFPLVGHVEVRYDPEKRRVAYEPVSIEPRVLVPRVIRDDNRYEPALLGHPPPPPGKPNG
ncbi:MAG: NADH-quinone oxidoreductase subunit C [Proteobacteria bacterium]|nr:NADH-quinone oxidoreductase subunit C [Pseudomonadota bacterium]